MRLRRPCAALPFFPLLLVLTPSANGATTLDCATCHVQEGQALKTSAHAGMKCATCHVGITTFPHPSGVSLPKCSRCHQLEATEWVHSIHGVEFNAGNKAAPNCQVCHGDAHHLSVTKTWAFKKSIPQLCGACHVKPFTNYKASVHGQAVLRGVTQAPTCTSCHTAHLIQPPTVPTSTVYPTQIPNTCGKCHGDVMMEREFNIPRGRLTSYQASFHGLALREGNLTAANCASCHGIHLILAASNPHSTINPRNLPKTCGKCHSDAGIRFAITPVHVLPGMNEPLSVSWVRGFYLVIIPLVVGLMFAHNLGDWIRKLINLRMQEIRQASLPLIGRPLVRRREEAGATRMYRFERLQHHLLWVSFLILAWTGFCFHWPHALFAAPFNNAVWGWRVRGDIHRIFAMIFMATGAIHIISLIQSPKLRRHWKLLWPENHDVQEAISNLAYNLGLRRERPPRSIHSYVEKAEYWALVWGAVLMSLTGLMLWGRNWVLRLLPMLSLQLASSIHFFEAVLATLAILIWHFYSVIFDPEVYPMDPAWLTGRSVKPERSEPGEGQEEAGPAPPASPGAIAESGELQNQAPGVASPAETTRQEEEKEEAKERGADKAHHPAPGDGQGRKNG